jgi:hypothetical protein
MSAVVVVLNPGSRRTVRLSMLWSMSMLWLPEPAGALGCTCPFGAGLLVAIFAEGRRDMGGEVR